ncbi:MAG TPA: galactose oxidase-like domain-containing protein [Gemmatimonadales bacterium]|nr:galactose oxidase-like domain-containing protein [Gemmatimonadales bacterium]
MRRPIRWTLRGLPVLALLVACGGDTPVARHIPPPPPPPPPLPDKVGQWSSKWGAPIVQLHAHLLLSGKVLTWGHAGVPQVWNPVSGVFKEVPSPSLLFCAGHDWLPDGRLFVAGGHISDLHGLPNANIFDPATETWQAVAPMARGRWYPTNTTLPDGEVLTLAGTDENDSTVLLPEIWNGSSWRQLTTASWWLPYYPRDFVAPDGRVFVAGEDQQSLWLDVSGTGTWTAGPVRQFGNRGYGSAVMYEPGKILYVGGGDPPTSTAEIIDLNQPAPVWLYTGSMQFARRQMDATLLPTGDVLVTGGTSGPGFNNYDGAVRAAEVWSPKTGVWTTLSSNAVTRLYHGTTLLLPDGRLLHTGSGDAGGTVSELNYELFSPPYLFNGPRPVVSDSTPAVVHYGQTIVVNTPDTGSITKVTFIRFSSVTHAFDQGARLVPLSFTVVTGGLSIAIPASRTVATPGPYLLFLVNQKGVPSVARIMLLN